MNCPFCGSCLISVIETRHTSNDVVTRKRRCLHCGETWPTAELVLPSSVIQYKKVLRRSGAYKGRMKPELSLRDDVLMALSQLKKNLAALTSPT